MQVFNENWKAAKGETRISLDARHHIQIQVSCTQDVQLLGLRGKEEIPLKIGREFRIRAQTKGFDALVLKGATEYGYSVLDIPRQDGEPLNDDNPPAPPMPGANNLIAQMQRLMRDEFNRHRPPVLDPEDLPWQERYVIDDDDYDFEEEIFASKQKSSPSPDNALEAHQTASPPAGDPPHSKPADPPSEAAE